MIRALNSRKGFTLVEVIVILAVLAILAAIAIPVALRIFQVTAEDTTRDEMANLKDAMIGNPRKLQSHFRSDFGFLGDMGRIPANLDELLVRGALPAFTFDTAKQAGAGWKGPYITGAAAGEAAEDFKKDQWGNSYTYSDVDFTNANGELADGKITSGGQDGVVGTADDIGLEILKNETSATVRGIVKTSAGDRFASVPVDIHSPVNGTLTATTATTDSNGNYTFTSVPFGQRSVQARPRLGYAPNTAITTGGGTDLRFTIINHSSSAVTLTSLTATYNFPGNCYREVWVDGVQVVNVDRCSGQVATFTAARTIAASTVVPPPLRVVVDAPDLQLPDLIIFPEGTSALVELRGFANPVNGIPFTITFSDGSVIKFTPVLGP